MPLSQPAEFLDWTDGSAGLVVDPPAPQKASGWTLGEPPPFEYMNWLFWNTDNWLKYLNQQVAVNTLQSVKYNVFDGQSAANLGPSYDGTAFTSVIFFYEIIRGTTVMCTGKMSIQFFNGVWKVVLADQDIPDGGADPGVTFSITTVGTIGQLKAALDSGAGNGTIKLKNTTFPV